MWRSQRCWTIRCLSCPRIRTVETQTVEGGRCVYEQRRGYEAKLDTVVDVSASCSPSQATAKNDNIQRNSKDIYNKHEHISLQ